jgi:hypothetical protein
MYIKRSVVEIQTPTHWNLIGGSMTALPPVLSPNSILRPPSSHCTFIPASEKFGCSRFCFILGSLFMFIYCIFAKRHFIGSFLDRSVVAGEGILRFY